MPSMSEKQRQFMGAELSRKREGTHTRTGMSEDQLEDFASKSLDTADDILVRKAVQEAYLEKAPWGRIAEAAAKYAPRIIPAATRLAGRAAEYATRPVRGFTAGAAGKAPKPATPTWKGTARPEGTAGTTWDKQVKRLGLDPKRHGPTGSERAGQSTREAFRSGAERTRTAASTAKGAPGKYKEAFKANPVRTTAVTALAGGVAAGALAGGLPGGDTDKGYGYTDPGGSELSELGHLGSKPEEMVRIQQPKQGTDVDKPKGGGQQTWMGRKPGKVQHAQMQQGYVPLPAKMLKEFLDNATNPKPAMSMPTTSAEMPVAVFNSDMSEIMGKNLPPVRMKVDDQDADVMKVTEGVMEKDWNPFKDKGLEETGVKGWTNKDSEKLWEHPQMQEMQWLIDTYPNTFGDKDDPNLAEHYELHRQDPKGYYNAYMNVHSPTDDTQSPPLTKRQLVNDPEVAKVTEAVMARMPSPKKIKVTEPSAGYMVKQGDMQQDQSWQQAQQIGQHAVDMLMMNPQLIPGAGGVKRLWNKMRGQLPASAVQDLQYHEETGMPLNPKTNLEMTPDEIQGFYSRVMGSDYAAGRGAGQEALASAAQQAQQKTKEEVAKPIK